MKTSQKIERKKREGRKGKRDRGKGREKDTLIEMPQDETKIEIDKEKMKEYKST